jgi:hypothetical protein
LLRQIGSNILRTFTMREKRALRGVDRAIARALKREVFSLAVHRQLIETQVTIDKAKRFGYFGEVVARRTNSTAAVGIQERSLQVISAWGDA